jgi:hypothetical protein
MIENSESTVPGANAPYKIQRRGNKYVVVNNAGLTKATFTTRAEALAYQRALYVNVPGAAKRADETKFTGKARNRIPEAAMWRVEDSKVIRAIDDSVVRICANTEDAVEYAANLESHLYLEKARKFDTATRKKLASTGAALPDGSYPIENTEDLRNAVRAYGRANDPDEVKAHIKKRAAALGASDILPVAWKSAGGY